MDVHYRIPFESTILVERKNRGGAEAAHGGQGCDRSVTCQLCADLRPVLLLSSWINVMAGGVHLFTLKYEITLTFHDGWKTKIPSALASYQISHRGLSNFS